MRAKLQPAPRLPVIVAVLALLAFCVAFLPDSSLAWAATVGVLAAAVVLLALATLDIVVLLRRPVPAIAREMPHAFALAHKREVALVVENTGGQPLAIELFDLHPAHAQSDGLPATATVPAGGRMRLPYQLRFDARGDFEMPGVHLRTRGPLDLFRLRHLAGEPFRVRVYPDFAAVARYALLATDHRLSQLGVRERQRRGEGLEFRQLREYRTGDMLRQVDWNATSRQQKLVSREYQDERDQQVMFLLDCGFRMRAQDDGVPHFDSALNAILLLAYVALRQGDAVGCRTFADGLGDGRLFAPAKGRATMSRLMNGLFDLQPSGRTPDFRRVAADCVARLHKRSLVVLVTNLRDEDTDDLLAAAKLLAARHLVIVATLREAVLDATLANLPENVDEARRVAATRLYLAGRDRALARLAGEGLRIIDCTPPQLPVRLVNAYLDAKRSGRL